MEIYEQHFPSNYTDMKTFYTTIFLFVAWGFITTSCKISGAATNSETNSMKIREKPEIINYASIKRQEIPSFSDRASQSRGFFAPLLGGAVSLATNAVKKMIANQRRKYTAEYSFGLTDLYFYDQLSLESVFDPVGLQFEGFILIRTFLNKNNQTDTALIARFELDTTSTNEIINNSIFRLKLTDFDMRHTKAKVSRRHPDINMDFEISFKTSYVNEMGQLFDNVPLGKFYLSLRNAPLNKSDTAYTPYYERLKGRRLEGKSFIVPRSFGYYKGESGNVDKSYSQGSYTITAKVTESSKDRFVTKILVDNSNLVIDMLGKQATKVLTK